MSPLDWLFIIIPLSLLTAIGFYTNRYTRSVVDFLSGGRMAKRYLLAISRGEMVTGAVVCVGVFEMVANSGFTMTWWSWMSVPVTLIVSITGYVVYRFRETRAMTLAQFFEIRYSKSFRISTGVLGFVAGLLNYSIVPAIEARFMTYFLGLPIELHFYSYAIPTYIPLMVVLMILTLFLALSGGLITLMVTNCLEGVVTQVLGLAIVIWLIYRFHWSEISTVLSSHPAGQSLLNPFDSMGLKDFNLGYALMVLFGSVYGTMAWQCQSGYNSAAISAHESRMAGLLGIWRNFGMCTILILLAVCGMTYLQHPDFAAQSTVAHTQIDQIKDPQLERQMTLPIAVVDMLPNGLKGALCVILLLGLFGGGGNHLHSWGSLLIQDVLMPLRKEALSPTAHIRILRWSMIGVGIFACIFGSFFRQTEYIFMWWQVTMSIYIGGAGAAIAGGLYWKKGTTAGAWTALTVGSGLSTTGIILRQIYGESFPLNGIQIGFVSMLLALTSYVLISLLTCREDFNLQRMLHRGPYALENEQQPKPPARRFSLWQLIGIDSDFTYGDKWIAFSLFGWSMLWFSIFVIGTVWNLVAPWPNSVWSDFWHVVGIGIPVLVCAITSIWFTWGGLRDTKALFHLLKKEKPNAFDNGMVVGHRNLDEVIEHPDMNGSTTASPSGQEGLPVRADIQPTFTEETKHESKT